MRVGLPRMHAEAGERRDFLPEFVRDLVWDGAEEIVLEQGYGSGMEIDPKDYLEAAPGLIRFASYEECLATDTVVVLRFPGPAATKLMRTGALLVSMIHVATRPGRARQLQELGVRGVSLDAVRDDGGRRLVENLQAVGWNGVEAAFKVIRATHPHFEHPNRRPVHVTCLGAGAVGGHAVRAATRYGDPKLREELVAKNVPGVEVTVVDFDLTWHKEYMLSKLEGTDLLIDAAGRMDLTRPVVPNAWLAAMPNDAVILDLASDPYVLDEVRPMVKGIEGVPQGDLDQYSFAPDDPAWDRVPVGVDTRNRRTALSCYAWPGVHPRSCMEVYGTQIEPIMKLILNQPLDTWDETEGTYTERAIARGELSRWVPSGA
jgi:alanine dehydrogenase